MDDFEALRMDGERGLRMTGELDLRTVPAFEEALATLPDDGQTKLDLSGLTFIDSSGLHAIMKFARAANGAGPLVLCGVTGWMLKIFEITHLSRHPDLDIRVADGE